MNVRIPAGVLIGLGAAASLLSGFVRREPSQTNDFVWLFPLEVVGTLLIGAAAVIARRGQATAIGLYVLLVAAAIATLFPLWLPEDDTVLGSALLAGILAGVGAGLALGVLPGILALVLVTAGGVVYPLSQVRLPLLVLVGVVAGVAWRRALPDRPLLVYVVVGAAATIALLLIRGPGDWASGSTTLKLYSFPILLVALGVSLALPKASEP